MKKMISSLLLMGCMLSSITFATAGEYEDAVSGWKSHEDVAKWLERNFDFSKNRQSQVIRRLKADGPDGLVVRNPSSFFKNSSGFCGDSAHFAIDALNRIDPSYNARAVFIWNEYGKPNHWVAAFDYEDKLYIMDYGTGRKWQDMQGIHGPYDSLDGYVDFLESLNVPRFKVADVDFRDMPGQQD